MFDFLTLVIAVVALIVARKTFNQAAALRARLDAIEAAGLQARPGPPPLTALDELEQTLAAPSPPIAAEAPPTAAVTEQASRLQEAEPETPNDAIGVTTAVPPPLPQAPPGFEERVGTRWVVWLGGLTLALGGFFMVRYSIDAGLLGPGVRTLLGGVFAFALLAAGEWTRRKENSSAIAALPIANIPAILTAAGTAVAFATVYAAYALYDFLAPATAFILLGLVALSTLAAALLHGPALAGLGIAAAFATPVLVSSEKPDFWALYLYLAVVTAAAFGLARIRLWRWLAVATMVFALLWTLPCLQCGPSMVAAHAFHVVTGFILATLLVGHARRRKDVRDPQVCELGGIVDRAGPLLNVAVRVEGRVVVGRRRADGLERVGPRAEHRVHAEAGPGPEIDDRLDREALQDLCDARHVGLDRRGARGVDDRLRQRASRGPVRQREARGERGPGVHGRRRVGASGVGGAGVGRAGLGASGLGCARLGRRLDLRARRARLVALRVAGGVVERLARRVRARRLELRLRLRVRRARVSIHPRVQRGAVAAGGRGLRFRPVGARRDVLPHGAVVRADHVSGAEQHVASERSGTVETRRRNQEQRRSSRSHARHPQWPYGLLVSICCRTCDAVGWGGGGDTGCGAADAGGGGCAVAATGGCAGATATARGPQTWRVGEGVSVLVTAGAAASVVAGAEAAAGGTAAATTDAPGPADAEAAAVDAIDAADDSVGPGRRPRSRNAAAAPARMTAPRTRTTTIAPTERRAGAGTAPTPPRGATKSAALRVASAGASMAAESRMPDGVPDGAVSGESCGMSILAYSPDEVPRSRRS
nr:DUF2339 domain-containing protein [Bradyrhizobium sp.]